MDLQKPATPLAAAIFAAQQFKEMLVMQPPGTLFFPGRRNRDARSTASFLFASELLDEVLLEHPQCAASTRAESKVVHSIGNVVSHQGTHVPPNLFQVVAQIATKLDVLIKLAEQSAGGGVHSSLLEVSSRLNGHGDESVEAVKGERDAVHGQGPEKVDEEALCHGTEVR